MSIHPHSSFMRSASAARWIPALALLLSACFGDGTADHALGGSVTGLTGSGLVIANGADTLALAAGATSFTMPAAVAEGDTYALTVQTQPTGQTCSFSRGSGTMGTQPVTNAALTCATDAHAVGGSVAGLSTGTLVLANGADTVSVAAGTGNFTLPGAVAVGGGYAVTVQTQPAGLTCSVANGSGTMGIANVTNVVVTCAVNSYTVGGTVSGLTGSLVLANGGDTVGVASGGTSFTLPGAVAFGGAYAVTVDTQPAGMTCSVTSGSGTMGAGNVTNVAVTCVANSFTVGGSISGLTAGGLVLANGSDTLAVPANATSFTLGQAVAGGTGYSVAVSTQPGLLTCSVTNGAGTMGAGNVINVSVSCTEAVVVGTLAGSGATGSANGSAATASFNAPFGVAVDGGGTWYVSDTGNHRIRKIAPDGSVSTFAGSGAAGFADGSAATAQFNEPTGLAVDGSGNVYVADRQNHRIRKIAPDGTVSTVAGNGILGSFDDVGTAARFAFPTGVALDAAGTVYVADLLNNSIRKIASDGTVSTLADSLAGPVAVAVDGAGTAYVAELFGSRISKVTAAGAVTTFAGSGTAGFAEGTGTAAQFDQPFGVALDSGGNVYVGDNANHRVRKITPAGVVSTLAGSGTSGFADGAPAAAMFNYPVGVALGTDGRLYVADQANQRVRRIGSAP